MIITCTYFAVNKFDSSLETWKGCNINRLVITFKTVFQFHFVNCTLHLCSQWTGLYSLDVNVFQRQTEDWSLLLDGLHDRTERHVRPFPDGGLAGLTGLRGRLGLSSRKRRVLQGFFFASVVVFVAQQLVGVGQPVAPHWLGTFPVTTITEDNYQLG